MTQAMHRTVASNGIKMHMAEQGTGPLVVLCHGFPESWYSWRHQLKALSDAGYRAVAPDMRGYGASGDIPTGTGGAWEAGSHAGMVNRKTGLLGPIADPPVLPTWLAEPDLDFYAAELARTGFAGA